MAKEISRIANDVSIMVCSTSEVAAATCRVCHCIESDQMGDAALEFLGIIPSTYGNNNKQGINLEGENVSEDGAKYSFRTNSKRKSVVEFVSPKGEAFVSNMKLGYKQNENNLLELGCACKNDLGIVHYACALKWFVNRGSTVCEVCLRDAKNVKRSDIVKVENALEECEILRENTENGEPLPTLVQQNSGMDPDAVAIRQQRLIEVSQWFNPDNHTSTSFYDVDEQPYTEEEVVRCVNIATKWVVEATGILLTTRFLVVILACLIAPIVGESTVKDDLYILLGGGSFTTVVFFRFFVLSGFKFGRAQYWLILILSIFSFLEIYYVG